LFVFENAKGILVVPSIFLALSSHFNCVKVLAH